MDGPRLRSWAFRGQRDARWPLWTALSRRLHDAGVDPRAWRGQEERILRIFRRKAHLFLDHIPDEDDSFQWLSLMAHHGAPTRLLDFTWSPYVAAYFALERAIADAAVWALCPPRLARPLAAPGGRGRVSRERVNLKRPGNYERWFLPGTLPVVYVGEPYVMNQRLVAQGGTFVVPGVLDRPVEAIVAQGGDDEPPAIVQLVLDTARMRRDAMRALYSMNITHATLFPGLDGLARSLAYELETHWEFDPYTMRVFPAFRRRRSGIGSGRRPAER